MQFIRNTLIASLIFLAGCLPNNKKVTYAPQMYHQSPRPVYNPLQFPNRKNQQIPENILHPNFQNSSSNQIIQSQRRIRYMRTQGRNPDYARGPFYKSAQEQIDAETQSANPRDPYDRYEAAKIRARVEEEWFWKRVQERTGKKPNIKRSKSIYSK